MILKVIIYITLQSSSYFLGPSTNDSSFRSYLLIGVFMQTIRSVKKNLGVQCQSVDDQCLLASYSLFWSLLFVMSLLLIFFVDVFGMTCLCLPTGGGVYKAWCVVQSHTLRM